jgi:hypothetical protein
MSKRSIFLNFSNATAFFLGNALYIDESKSPKKKTNSGKNVKTKPDNQGLRRSYIMCDKKA